MLSVPNSQILEDREDTVSRSEMKNNVSITNQGPWTKGLLWRENTVWL